MTCMPHHKITNSIILSLLLALIISISAQDANTCTSSDSSSGTCTQNNNNDNVPPKNSKKKATFRNSSPYRADVHLDDGRFGEFINVIEANDGNTLDIPHVSPGDTFFITRHGVREPLVDPATDTQYYFTVSKGDDEDGTDEDYEFVVPRDAAPSATKCRDRYPVCVSEAARGECTNNPGWMIVNCCKSCDDKEGFGYLLDSKVRCSRTRLNATTPAWQDGSLNDLFAKWATDETYKQYEPRVISSPGKEFGAEHDGPWIVVFDSFLSDYEINALINGARFDGFKRSTDQGAVVAGSGEKEKKISSHRTSSNAWCMRECEQLPGVESATKRIEDFTGIPRNNYESFQILKYNVGEYYKPHHDSSGAKDSSVSGHRIMTFFLYLNDVPEGGETRFTNLDISVQPKKGRALVWPSVLNEDPNKSDSRMYHEARPVIKGIKYAANHWIHQYDSKNENLWGCSGSFS